MASVAVVVCTYTDARSELFAACVESILRQLRADDPLIVVVDHNPQLLEKVSARYGTQATVIANTHERGLSGARNSGVDAVSCNIVAFIDDDAEIEAGWLERLRVHYHDPAVAGVGGSAQPVWPDGRPPWFPSEFDWVVGCSHRGLPSEVTPVRNFLGCNMSFRRTALELAGGFSPAMGRVGTKPTGCEETELCIRLKQASPVSQLLLDPGITVRHWVSQDRTRLSYFVHRCFSEGLSKHRLSSMVGSSDALQTERHYVWNVLPMGFARGAFAAVTIPGGRLGHLGQSMALIVGLVATAAGYVVSAVRSW
jgi:glycosyltransferase involved in cell wall biosynthesis